MGRLGLEPRTNPESFRGCSQFDKGDCKTNTATWGFFLRFNFNSRARASAIVKSCLLATSSTSLPRRRVV